MSDISPVDVARAALLEVGRPDLAAAVFANRAGNPRVGWPLYHEADTLVPAFVLGHQATGHDARLGTFDGLPCVDCATCYDAAVARHAGEAS